MPRNDPPAGAAHDIVSLARARIGAASSIYYAPSIPPAKETAARRSYAAHLADREPILVLYDATLLGGANEGFVITNERLCWRNFLEQPRQIAWADVDVAGVAADGSGVRIAGDRIISVGAIAPAVASVFAALAERIELARGGPYRAVASAGALDAGTAQIVAFARAHVGEIDGIFYAPTIPRQKLANVRATHAAHLPADEAVAVVYDDTFFGSARDGFLLTAARVCWKNIAQDPEMIPWDQIQPTMVAPNGNAVQIMDRSIHVAMYPERSGPIAALIATIAREAQARGAP